MKNSKLKSINRQIESLFQPSPKTTSPYLQENSRPAYQQYQGCKICDEVRRQNYKLKQQILKTQQLQEEAHSLRQELAAVQQLYQLKCQEANLFQQRLIQCQKLLARTEEDKKSLTTNTTQYFQRLLAGDQ